MNEYLFCDTETGEIFGIEACTLTDAFEIMRNNYDAPQHDITYRELPNGMLERLGIDVY